VPSGVLLVGDSVFKTLSGVNVNTVTEKKGQFTYLSWSDAWTELMNHYPDATHDMLEDVHYSDGTMEVRSSITINGQTLKCFLPVIDHRNKAISNPNAFDVNKNRMRCLAKNIALFGLGLYIFRGEDLPQEPVVEETPLMIRAGAEINAAFEADDYPGAAQLWEEWSQEELAIIARAPSKGGQLTTANRTKMKETAFRHALNEVRGISMEGVA
jgi:hypothetical protein